MQLLLNRVVAFNSVRFSGSSFSPTGPHLKRLAKARNMILSEMQDRSTGGLMLTFEGRIKSYLSIWRKAERKQLPLNKIYDVQGLRIIVDND